MKTALIALTAALGLSTAASAMAPHTGAAGTLSPRDNVQIDAAHFSDTVLGAVSVDADMGLTPRDRIDAGATVSFYRGNTDAVSTQETPR
jgi:hypothetical protein